MSPPHPWSVHYTTVPLLADTHIRDLAYAICEHLVGRTLTHWQLCTTFHVDTASMDAALAFLIEHQKIGIHHSECWTVYQHIDAIQTTHATPQQRKVMESRDT